MKVVPRVLLIATVLAAALATPARAATPAAVNAAIQRGVQYLYKQQKKTGCWEEFPTPLRGGLGLGNGVDDGQWGGRSALVTYALLAAGERPLDARMIKAVDWLRDAPIVGNYALGVRANVWFYLPQTKANLDAMTKDAVLLNKGRSNSARAPNFGFFDYLAGGGRVDLSCSQYGVLGCWAASQRVKAFDEKFWSTIENSWHAQQNDDGGWGYNGRGVTSTIQMTAAGVATLFITQELAHATDDADPAAALKLRQLDDDINRGMDFLGNALAGHLQNPILYALYGIERVGVAGGHKYIGDVDWYRACSDALLASQGPDGAWPEDYVGDRQINTAFALLVLSRGRAPVMVNKLQFDLVPKRTAAATRPADWNLRPRDIANVTRWVEERTERRLNWQSVKLSAATVDDLHDAPLLYMTGRFPISLRDEDVAKLKQYVEEGGIVIASTDANSAFGKTFRTLGESMFPGLTFKPLDEKSGNVLVNGEQFPMASQKRPVKVEAIDNGARVLMLLVPDADLSTSYQRRETTARESAYQFMANAYLYAIEKTGRPTKGVTHVVRPDPATQPTKSATVARIQHSGRWDPEPGGWRRLAAVMHNTADTELTINTVTPETIGKPTIAHLTGTDAFTLTDVDRAAIKAYLDRGGLLLIDACGGDAAFDVSARAELTKLFPDAESQLLNPLPPAFPLFTDAAGKLFTDAAGKPIEPKYRDFALPMLGPQSKTFQLRGIAVNGKLVVVYSPQDLSEGLVGQPVDGIIGYTPEVATELVRRLIELRVAGKL